MLLRVEIYAHIEVVELYICQEHTCTHTEILQTFMLEEYRPRLSHGMVQFLAL